MSDGIGELETLLARELAAPVRTSPARKARIMALVRRSVDARARRARSTGRHGYLLSSLGVSLAAVLAGVLIAGAVASRPGVEPRQGVAARVIGDSIAAALHDTAHRVGLAVADTQWLVDSAGGRVVHIGTRPTVPDAESRAVPR